MFVSSRYPLVALIPSTPGLHSRRKLFVRFFGWDTAEDSSEWRLFARAKWNQRGIIWHGERFRHLPKELVLCASKRDRVGVDAQQRAGGTKHARSFDHDIAIEIIFEAVNR